MLARRTDSNQTDIVDALRKAGVSVAITSHVGGGFPDLVCGLAGKTFLLEVKAGGDKLTPRQSIFHAFWSGHLSIVSTPAEALAAVGLETVDGEPANSLENQPV